MNFFEHQERAHRRTKVLILYFVAAVTAIIALVYALVMLLFQRGRLAENPERWWDGSIFGGVTVATLAIVGFGSLYKIYQLRRGGGQIAQDLGGRRVDGNTEDPDHRRLLNVVEEMAIASGTPVPEVYVLEDEKGINAFAAGHSSGDVAIGVTRGAVQHLTRDELQGVIAHEFSHILNGDMRLNLRLMGVLHGILCLTLIGRVLLRTRGRKNPLPVLGLGLIVIGSVGIFFSKLIKSAISRQREFLADASAVQFTRLPAGLAGALKKIGGMSYGSRLHSPRAEETSHMFFGNGLSENWLGWMSTHPPLAQRIRLLDATFDGTFVRIVSAAPLRMQREPELPLADLVPRRRAPEGPPQTDEHAHLLLAPESLRADEIFDQAGTVNEAQLQFARAFLTALPAAIREAAHQPEGAMAIIYCLCLTPEPGMKAVQIERLSQREGTATANLAAQLEAEVAALPLTSRVPLVDLCLPALRNLSADQFTSFCATTRDLIESDQEINLFERLLQHTLRRHLEPEFGLRQRTPVQYYALRPLLGACGVVFSALANAGGTSADAGREAFLHGVQALPLKAREDQQLVYAEGDLGKLDQALDLLAQATPPLKELILRACGQVVASDGIVQAAEAEVLRVIADSLDCPIPPFTREVLVPRRS